MLETGQDFLVTRGVIVENPKSQPVKVDENTRCNRRLGSKVSGDSAHSIIQAPEFANTVKSDERKQQQDKHRCNQQLAAHAEATLNGFNKGGSHCTTSSKMPIPQLTTKQRLSGVERDNLVNKVHLPPSLLKRGRMLILAS